MGGGREYNEDGCIYSIPVADFMFIHGRTNTMLKSNYPTIRNKFFKMRGGGFHECHIFLCVHRKECVINI